MSDLGHRMARLLEAMRQVESDNTPETILQRVVEAACELVAARYGALLVLDERGEIADFVSAGMTDAEVAAIGPRPVGKGVLGMLIREPRPVRIDDVAGHPEAMGFPPGHPPVRALLGVPVRGRDRILGNFYLADKAAGVPFSSDDEELTVALAAWAGVTIENARLYEATHQREQWLDAARQVTTALLSGAPPGVVLSLVASRARQLVGADTASIAVPDEAGEELLVAAADGRLADEIRGMAFPMHNSLSGAVMERRAPMIVDDAQLDERGYQPVIRAAGMGPAMYVPIHTRGQVFGTLNVANHRGGRTFTSTDLTLVESFADQAAMALEFGRAQREMSRVVLLEERQRIAHDLHDTIIQRLFATGMALQATARLAHSPEVVRRLTQAVDDLDATVRDIRSTIFSLETVNRQGRGMRSDVLSLAGEAAGSIGFDPQVRFEGQIDDVVTDDLADQLLFALREALSNVARHAKATSAEVYLGVDDDIVLRVSDDGVGAPPLTSRHATGLASMADRARLLGGTFDIRDGEAGGTVVEWRIPRPPGR